MVVAPRGGAPAEELEVGDTLALQLLASTGVTLGMVVGIGVVALVLGAAGAAVAQAVRRRRRA